MKQVAEAKKSVAATVILSVVVRELNISLDGKASAVTSQTGQSAEPKVTLLPHQTKNVPAARRNCYKVTVHRDDRLRKTPGCKIIGGLQRVKR
ncbi:MAG: hypothetical protein WCD53_19050 [Microcoleus sp.]